MWSPDEVRAENTPDPYIRWPAKYLELLVTTYEPARRLGIPTDAIRLGDDLGPYRLLILPSHRIFDMANAPRLLDWVRDGGVLVATAKTAHQDLHGVYFGTPGGPLRELLGFEVRRDVRATEEPIIVWGDERYQALAHFEQIESVEPDTEVLANFDGGLLHGRPAVLSRPFGRGHLFYAAAVSRDLIARLLVLGAAKAGIETFSAPDGLVILPQPGDAGSYWIFNDSAEEKESRGISVPARDFRRIDRTPPTP